MSGTMPADAVVVTGIGIVGPLGARRDEFWSNLVAGRTGIAPAGDAWGDVFAGLPIGLVTDELTWSSGVSGEHAAPVRAEQMAVASAREAAAQSRALDGSSDPERV